MIWFFALTAVVMFAIGSWGARHSSELVPAVLSAEEQAKRGRVYRRGARVLQFTALLFLGSIAVAVVSRFLSS